MINNIRPSITDVFGRIININGVDTRFSFVIKKKYIYVKISTNFNKEVRPRINTDASTSEKSVKGEI